MADHDAAWRLRPRLTARQQRWFESLSALEPGLRLNEIAARVGEPYATVQRWASFFGYEIRDGRGDRPARVAWNQVNWRKSNVIIARELGVTRERVRQVRAEKGIEPEKSSAQKFAQFVAAHRRELQDLSVQKAMRASGLKLSYEVARDTLRTAGVGPFRRSRKNLEVDWRLPNRDLAEIHGVSVQQIANLRFRLEAGPAQWDARGGRLLTDRQYIAARKKEEQRAKKIAAGRGHPAASTTNRPSKAVHEKS